MPASLDVHFVLSLFHLAFVVPLFLFVAFQRADTPRWMYQTFLAIGVLVGSYHAFKLIRRWYSGSSLWVSALHVFLVAPLLAYIGYHGKDTPRSAYELLLMAGFGAGGYHLFQLVKSLEAWPEPEKRVVAKLGPSYLHSMY
jgi:hypothetical protein